MIPPALALLQRVCVRRGLRLESVDPFSDHLVRITAPASGKSAYAGAGALPTYPGNDFVLGAAAKDKAFTGALLSHFGFRVPDGAYFFTRADFIDQRPPGKEIADARHFLETHFSRAAAPPLVVKPNSLSRARLVSLARNADEAMADLSAIAKADLICHFQHLIDDPEFRLFLLEGEILFCYAKGRPQVTGDGTASVLVLTDNVHPQTLCDPRYLDAVLRARGIDWQSVLPAGAVLPTHFIANLGATGDFKGFVEVSEEVRVWARRIYTVLPLKVMGIDVFSASGLNHPEDFTITDVNGSPALSTLDALGHGVVVEAVWDRILDATF